MIEKLISLALAKGADKAGVVDMADVVFDRAFRDTCRTNVCGQYGKNWACPPDVGEIDELMANAKRFSKMLVFQTIRPLEDSYDFEGMQEAAALHRALVVELYRLFREQEPDGLMLSAGGCNYCERCTRKDDLPCCAPENALASLEAYGVNVSELAAAAGMKYINGQNTVTYFGAFLYRE